MLALDRFPEWMHDVKSVEYTSQVRTPEDKYTVGASAHWVEVKKEEFDFEITESLENEKLVGRTSPHHGAIFTTTFALKPAEAGTQMTYAVDYEMPWGILGKILDKLLMRRALQKGHEGDLAKLKTILER